MQRHFAVLLGGLGVVDMAYIDFALAPQVLAAGAEYAEAAVVTPTPVPVAAAAPRLPRQPEHTVPSPLASAAPEPKALDGVVPLVSAAPEPEPGPSNGASEQLWTVRFPETGQY